MSGNLDDLYIQARQTLLDALEALGPHRQSVILVGAQAVYVQVGEGEIAVPPYTTDADLALDAAQLGPAPLIEEAMVQAGFSLVSNQSKVGTWAKPGGSEIDLMVPAYGSSRRSADIPPHRRGVARRVSGIEGALVDNDERTIQSLDPQDTRSFTVNVAGPAALLVAKLLKIADRKESASRHDDKDALDLYRLLQVTDPDVLTNRLRLLLRDERWRPVTLAALSHLRVLFANPAAEGCDMLARAVEGLEDPQIIRQSCSALATDLVKSLEGETGTGAVTG